MKNRTASKATRRIAVLLIGLLLFLLLFPLFSHHDCTGEDCPVCAFFRQTEQALTGLFLLLFCAKNAPDILFHIGSASEERFRRNPVSRHDKMTD